MGPGKPYWKSPEGSTGAAAARALGSIVAPIGTGVERAFAGTLVVGVVAVVAWAGLLMPKTRAVVAAPTAADAPATAARVNLLILSMCGRRRRRGTNGRGSSTSFYYLLSEPVYKPTWTGSSAPSKVREFHMPLHFCAANQRVRWKLYMFYDQHFIHASLDLHNLTCTPINNRLKHLPTTLLNSQSNPTPTSRQVKVEPKDAYPPSASVHYHLVRLTQGQGR